MEISLGVKYTSRDLDLLNKGIWEQSFQSKVVSFDFQKLEWISLSEISFIYGWIFQLLHRNIKVTIRLQDADNIDRNSKVYERRQRCYTTLVFKYSLLAVFQDEEGKSLVAFDHHGMRTNDRYKPIYDDSLIPFYRIKAGNYKNEEASKEFEVIQRGMLENVPMYERIKEMLNQEGLNQIDNNSLTYVLTKELYTNACYHGYSGNNLFAKECYLSIGYEKKIAYTKENENNWKLRLAEKSQEEQGFYERNHNRSFLNYTFLDFGNSIPNTLFDKFHLSIDAHEDKKYKSQLSSDFFSDSGDSSKILEYAFLIFTSRNEFNDNLLFHDFLPRGLYVVKDIVRRNNGMLVVRSGSGKIVFDYSYPALRIADQVKYTKESVEFPGTMLSIILPSISDNKINYVPEKLPVKYNFKDGQIKVLGLLELYTKINNARKVHSNLTKEFFIEIANLLRTYNEEDCNILVLFDYAGIDIKYHEFSRNLIYYLSLTALVNDRVQVMLYNLCDFKTVSSFANLSQSLSEADEERKDKLFKGLQINEVQFLAKPIPVLFPDLDIFWIGIDSIEQQSILNGIWKKNSSEVKLETLKNVLFENHFLSILLDKDRKPFIQFTIPHLNLVYDAIMAYQDIIIQKEVANIGMSFDELIYTDEEGKVHNYNNVSLRDDDGNWYFAANGYYQEVFLSFIEKIYIREYRRFIATQLITKYEISQLSNTKGRQRPTKILTVTLSSELLGKEVKDIYLSLVKGPKDVIYLIPLSNYFDFEQEEPFKDIVENDKIIVVNDVVSTGSLSNKINTSLDNKYKFIEVLAFLSVVDARKYTDTYPDISAKMISLSQSPANLEKKPAHGERPVWISPIINAPITMKRNKEGENNILLNLSDFFELLDAEPLLHIGNVRHNTTHHTYYLMAAMLYKIDKERGFPLIKHLFKLIYERNQKYTQQTFSDQIVEINDDLVFLQERLENLETALSSLHIDNETSISKKIVGNTGKIERIREELAKSFSTVKQHSSQTHIDFNQPDVSVDYIFLPFLSSAMDIMDDIPSLFREFNKDRIVEVFPIPRINTPKGWRFTFPPKFLNSLNKNNKARVLILDDGSWTGETLIQMIDCVCFLPVKDITVLSIVARLDDYQRDFLSRVKKIRSKRRETTIKIYFGVSLNIPVYPASSNLFPFNVEEKELNSIGEMSISQAIKEYIELRRLQIKSIDTTINADNRYPTKIPSELLKTKIFLLRNFIGRYESYRLFKEDIDELVDNAEKNFSDIDSLAAIVLHEPYLISIIERIDISRGAVSKLKNYVLDVLNEQKTTCWDNASMLRLYSIADKYSFCSWDFLDKALKFCKDQKAAINFIVYFLFKTFIEKDEKNIAFKKNIYVVVRDIYDNSPMRTYAYQSFRQLLNVLAITPTEESYDIFVASSELAELFTKENTEGGHDCLDTYIENLINELSKSEPNPQIEEWNIIYDGIKTILKGVNVLQPMLKQFKSKFLKTLIGGGPEQSLSNVSKELDAYFLAYQDSIKSDATYIIGQLEFIKTDILENSSTVSQFFYDYMCDIKAVWAEMLTDFREKRNVGAKRIVADKKKDNSLNQRPVVDIHKAMLKNVFVLFLENIRIHVKDNIEVRYYFIIEKNWIKICFEQDQVIDLNVPGGFGLRRIDNILKYYGGGFKYFVPEGEHQYTAFEIIFPNRKK